MKYYQKNVKRKLILKDVKQCKNNATVMKQINNVTDLPHKSYEAAKWNKLN